MFWNFGSLWRIRKMIQEEKTRAEGKIGSTEKHIKYQMRELPRLRKTAGVHENATLFETIIALVKGEDKVNATELLFASGRTEEIGKDKIGFGLYINLWTGLLPSSFVSEIAAHHHWSNKTERGFAIEVYPEEYLVIEEPIATKVLTAWSK